MFINRYTAWCCSLAAGALFVLSIPSRADTLPPSVQTKIESCQKYLDDAVSELDARQPKMAREPLRGARERLESIQNHQRDKAHWDHPDVKAARDRYAAVDARFQADMAKYEMAEQKVPEYLTKLQEFRSFNPEATYPEHVLASKPAYEAAKALINQILADGCDGPLSGYSDYKNTKMNVDLWVEARDRVVASFIETAREYKNRNTTREKSWLDQTEQRLADITAILPAGDPRIDEARTAVDEMQAAIQQQRLEDAAKVTMRAEAYKGKDAAQLRVLANKAVQAKFPQSRILKTKLISPAWGAPEGGLQWTDNTRSAVERRTTSYFSVEIAAKQGDEVWLHRVYLYKERVNGKLMPAKSYVVGSQLMLEKNVK